ncbi:uncharacterized protein LOC129589950 [Paramacrobiotus metropolitanus]|uniref:uncharacterized protein LOC129589950 n=1 Tax=Paramacrobiotus metropolitanus TaxID=2943436 RepID=UPI00244653A7|nr:uncharacterized protein LOC129589950 [Paramacrobiotus metropolitanus]
MKFLVTLLLLTALMAFAAAMPAKEDPPSASAKESPPKSGVAPETDPGTPKTGPYTSSSSLVLANQKGKDPAGPSRIGRPEPGNPDIPEFAPEMRPVKPKTKRSYMNIGPSFIPCTEEETRINPNDCNKIPFYC